MSYKIGRPINGVFLNGLEYICDEKGSDLKFGSEEWAVQFLVDNTYMTMEEIEEALDDCSLVIEEVYDA